MTTLAIAGGVLALIIILIAALVRRSTKGARAEQRSDALESNLEATHEAERHLDQGETPLAQRRHLAAVRRMRRERSS